MRAGPLSHSRVITLLNRYFVPVYTSNEDFTAEGSASPSEKELLKKVFAQGYASQESVGSVHVYILSPEGKFFGSLHVADAAQSSKLLDLLDRAVQQFNPAPGEPLITPKPQSQPPPMPAGGLLLHLTARALGGGGAWGEFPAENWIVLTPAECQDLLPRTTPASGLQWNVPPETSARLFKYFYPATENNHAESNVIEHSALSGKVTSVAGGRIEAALEGALRMRHTFYQRPDTNRVEATVVGFIEFDRAKTITALKVVTDEARYGPGKFGIALENVSPASATRPAPSR